MNLLLYKYPNKYLRGSRKQAWRTDSNTNQKPENRLNHILFEEFTIRLELLSKKTNLQIENQKQTTGEHAKNIVKNRILQVLKSSWPQKNQNFLDWKWTAQKI